MTRGHSAVPSLLAPHTPQLDGVRGRLKRHDAAIEEGHARRNTAVAAGEVLAARLAVSEAAAVELHAALKSAREALEAAKWEALKQVEATRKAAALKLEDVRGRLAAAVEQVVVAKELAASERAEREAAEEGWGKEAAALRAAATAARAEAAAAEEARRAAEQLEANRQQPLLQLEGRGGACASQEAVAGRAGPDHHDRGGVMPEVVGLLEAADKQSEQQQEGCRMAGQQPLDLQQVQLSSVPVVTTETAVTMAARMASNAGKATDQQHERASGATAAPEANGGAPAEADAGLSAAKRRKAGDGESSMRVNTMPERLWAATTQSRHANDRRGPRVSPHQSFLHRARLLLAFPRKRRVMGSYCAAPPATCVCRWRSARRRPRRHSPGPAGKRRPDRQGTTATLWPRGVCAAVACASATRRCARSHGGAARLHHQAVGVHWRQRRRHQHQHQHQHASQHGTACSGGLSSGPARL
jgi:hypothetical protein